MDTKTERLNQLRDIHLPEPISLWPLAPGWYILALIIIVICAIVAGYFYRRWQQKALQRTALKQYHALYLRYQQTGHPQQVVIEMSALLRRIALARFPRHEVAGLMGNEWLAFLDKTGNTHIFSQGIGRLLATAPYTKQAPNELHPLFPIVKQWIELNT